MKECDEFVCRTFEGFLVDELATGVFGLRELVFNIICGKGDMVDAAMRIFLKELSDGAVG